MSVSNKTKSAIMLRYFFPLAAVFFSTWAAVLFSMNQYALGTALWGALLLYLFSKRKYLSKRMKDKTSFKAAFSFTIAIGVVSCLMIVILQTTVGQSVYTIVVIPLILVLLGFVTHFKMW